MRKKLSLGCLFPKIYEEIRDALKREMPFRLQKQIDCEANIVLGILIEEKIVVVGEYTDDRHRVAIGLFVYLYNIHLTKHVWRLSRDVFLSRVINAYYYHVASQPRLPQELKSKAHKAPQGKISSRPSGGNRTKTI